MTVFPWERYWAPRGVEVDSSPEGFVADLGATSSAQNVFSFDQISSHNVLILLGEPAMGKSTALKAECQNLELKRGAEDRVLFVDLRFHSSSQDLRQLFEGAPFQDWLSGSGTLHLFVDSLDEALRICPSMGLYFFDQVSRLDISRLMLRVACRTAEWPHNLTSLIAERWGGEPQFFRLLPLSRKDVELAAGSEGIEVPAFLSEVFDRSVLGLAVKPGTLLMLLQLFKTNGDLRASRAELYLKACLRFADDVGGPAAQARQRTLGIPQILAIAERMAAVTMICGRETIWAGEADLAPFGSVLLRDLWGDGESWRASSKENEVSVDVTDLGIHEVLRTGLFSGSGDKRFTWAHHTYGEFLGARYIVRKRPDAALSLVTVPQGGRSRLVPQLREIVAWFAELQPDAWEAILKLDPTALLRCDLRELTDTQRESLVSALLEVADERGRDELLALDFQALRHPGIAEQLLSVIGDREVSIRKRQLALEIGEDCAMEELAPQMVEVALDASDVYYVRVAAARAVCFKAQPTIRQMLRPLLDYPGATDPDDQLKGLVLEALWPDYLSVEDLVSHLLAPQRDAFYGSYWNFLGRQLVPALTVEDLPVALAWAAEQERDPHHSVMNQLHDQIIDAGLSHIAGPQVACGLVRVAVRALCGDLSLFYARDFGRRDSRLADPSVRTHLVERLIPVVMSGEMKPRMAVVCHPPMLLAEDIPWLLKRLSDSDDHAEQIAWSQLVDAAMWPGDTEYVLQVLEAVSSSPALAEVLEPRTRPMELDSDEAGKLRASYQRAKSLQREPDVDAEPACYPKLIADALSAKQGYPGAAWISVARAMRRTAGGRPVFDLRQSPGWEETTDDLKSEILGRAARFLGELDPGAESWYRDGQIPWSAIHGYQALVMLAYEMPAQLRQLDGVTWERWMPVMLVCSRIDREESLDADLLRSIAYESCPQSYLAWVVRLAQSESEQGQHVTWFRELEEVWDDQAEACLIDVASDPANPFLLSIAALSMLLGHQVEAAGDLAKQFVPPIPPTEAEPRLEAVESAALLLVKSDSGFDHVWRAGAQDDGFLDEVLRHVVAGLERYGEQLSSHLTERQLADLFLWLEEHYPHAEDEERMRNGYVTPEHALRLFRDSILDHLQERATRETVSELERLRLTLPTLQFLDLLINRARDAWARQAWTPASPSELIRFTADPNSRLVENGEELLEVLLESVGRAEDYLHGENRPMVEVWNYLADSKYRPKSEQELSDWLARFIRRDIGESPVVVNREVEVSRGQPASLGDSTDVYVTALAKEPNRSVPVSVVIEVKGNWNSELLTGLQQQLVGQYLVPVGLTYGIYVVGCFAGEEWDRQDGRRTKAARHTSEDLRTELERQAEVCSQEPNVTVKAVLLDLGL